MKETFLHLLNKLQNYQIEFLGLILVFLYPIKMLLILCGLVIFIDLFLGINKSIKHKGWKSITSKGLYATVQKMFVYQGVIIGCYFLDSRLLNEFILLLVDIPLFLTKIVTIGLVYVELKSINENIELIWNINIFQRVIESVKSIFTIKKQFDKYNE